MTSLAKVDVGQGEVGISYAEWGDLDAPPILLLHGSGGVSSLGSVVHRLAPRYHVIVPSHPGFDGTSLSDAAQDARALAQLYLGLLEVLALRDVTVSGFSFGGWVAMEMAVSRSNRIARLALVDPIGVAVSGHPIVNPGTMTSEEAVKVNFHDPTPYLARAAAADEQERSMAAANSAAVTAYTRVGLSDATLLERLSGMSLPTLVLFGESERVVPMASANAILHAVSGPHEFIVIPQAGHRPQLERPEAVEQALSRFIDRGL